MPGVQHPPLIGVTVDHHDAEPPSEATYTVRRNYVDALNEAGAAAVLLPFDRAAVPRYAELCDGLLVTGSIPGHPGSTERQMFDKAMIRAVMDRERPVLGICNGLQMMGLVLGGRVVDVAAGPHGPDHAGDCIAERLVHGIRIADDGLLHRIGMSVGDKHGHSVNSLHRQALDRSGAYTVSAEADDKGVEAIELTGHPFALGVQWHPEYRLTALDRAILAAFVAACRPTRAPTLHPD